MKNYNYLAINKRDNKEVELIELCNNGNIRIWNFHTGELLKEINLYSICDYGACSLCLWDNEYLFIVCTDKTIKLVRLKDGKIIRSLSGHNNQPIFLKRVNHPKYGEAFVSQGLGDDSIKLWLKKFNKP